MLIVIESRRVAFVFVYRYCMFKYFYDSFFNSFTAFFTYLIFFLYSLQYSSLLIKMLLFDIFCVFKFVFVISVLLKLLIIQHLSITSTYLLSLLVPVILLAFLSSIENNLVCICYFLINALSLSLFLRVAEQDLFYELCSHIFIFNSQIIMTIS